jgi:tartrate dehydratase alpha subunit/fumarate hydratase class I-like protein
MERRDSPVSLAIEAIARNVDMACERCGPICQDTGLPFFQVMLPPGVDPLLVSEAIGEAVAEATRQGNLRPNSVDSLTGRNSGDNLGPGTPLVHFEPCVSDELEIRLLLAGRRPREPGGACPQSCRGWGGPTFRRPPMPAHAAPRPAGQRRDRAPSAGSRPG